MPRWTSEASAKQAALIATWQPWCASTGPRSADGKAKVARNADQGGDAGRAARLQRAQADLAEAQARVELLSKRRRRANAQAAFHGTPVQLPTSSR